jgi:putative spermidine/putrescine transport system permease protein
MLTNTSRGTRIAAGLCALPFLFTVLAFEVLPLLLVARNSLASGEARLTLANYADIVTSGFQRNAFVTSLTLSLGTAAIAILLGLPIGVLLRRMPARLERFVLTYSNLCANFTGFPVAFAFIIMFGISGFFTLLLARLGFGDGLNIYSTGGLALVFSYFQIPLGLLLVYPSLGAITPEIVEAAQLMGARRASFWLRIGLPILWPSLLGSFILLFANAMGTYATAFAVAGGNANLVTIRIGELIQGDVFAEPNLAAALSMLLVASLAAPIAFEQLFLKRKQADA